MAIQIVYWSSMACFGCALFECQSRISCLCCEIYDFFGFAIFFLFLAIQNDPHTADPLAQMAWILASVGWSLDC